MARRTAGHGARAQHGHRAQGAGCGAQGAGRRARHAGRGGGRVARTLLRGDDVLDARAVAVLLLEEH
eukprot:3366279-Prymnesium_polylepis.1